MCEDLSIVLKCCYTNTFANQVHKLPSPIQKTIDRVIEFVRQSPQNSYSRQIEQGLYRIYITKKYRLFYDYDHEWLELLSVLKRDEDTYTERNLDAIQNLKVVSWAQEQCVELEDLDDTKNNHEQLLSKEHLKQWNIPEQYWPSLENVSEDNLLDSLYLHLNNFYANRILDNLYPRDIMLIKKEHKYNLSSTEDVFEILAREDKELLLRLHPKQKEILDLESEQPILVKGGAGTGKSIIALYKVKQFYQKGLTPVLFTTHTPFLANYSRLLLSAMLGKQSPKDLEELGIHVRIVDNLTATPII